MSRSLRDQIIHPPYSHSQQRAASQFFLKGFMFAFEMLGQPLCGSGLGNEKICLSWWHQPIEGTSAEVCRRAGNWNVPESILWQHTASQIRRGRGEEPGGLQTFLNR